MDFITTATGARCMPIGRSTPTAGVLEAVRNARISIADRTSSYSGTDYQVKNPLGYWSNAEYYFEMWPVTSGTADNNEGDTGSCSASACCFTVQIINTSYTTVFGPHTYSVPNPPGSQTDVIGIDPNFCTGGSGPNIGSEQGYVTAGLLYTPTITDLSSGNALILSRVFVGK